MNKNFQAADILHFDKYIFTDTNKFAMHFAMVLLPPSVMDFENNLLCSVITSRRTKYFALELKKTDYKFFPKPYSYVCLNRRDINSIEDLSDYEQPLGRLQKNDIKNAFKILKKILYGTDDTYLVATIVREWKKIKYNQNIFYRSR